MVKGQRSKNNRREAELAPEVRNDDPTVRSEPSYLPPHKPAYFPSPALVQARDAQVYIRQENSPAAPPLPAAPPETNVPAASTASAVPAVPAAPAVPPAVPPLPSSSTVTSDSSAPVPPSRPPAPILPTTTIYYGPSAPPIVTLTPLSTVKPCTTNDLIQSFFRFSLDAGSWCSTYLASLHDHTTPAPTDRVETELGLPVFVSSFYYPRITNLGPFDRDDMLSGCSCWYPWTALETKSTTPAIVVSPTTFSSRSSISTLSSITTIAGATGLQSSSGSTSTSTNQPKNGEFLVRMKDGTSGSVTLVPMFILLPIAAIVGAFMFFWARRRRMNSTWISPSKQYSSK